LKWITKILKKSNDIVPNQVKVNIENVETIWEWEYNSNEICTILWGNTAYKFGKVPKGRSDNSLFYWNGSHDGKLRRIRFYPEFNNKIVLGEVWTRLEKVCYVTYDSSSVGENMPFIIK
jgi:hypothetical protein